MSTPVTPETNAVARDYQDTLTQIKIETPKLSHPQGETAKAVTQTLNTLFPGESVEIRLIPKNPGIHHVYTGVFDDFYLAGIAAEAGEMMQKQQYACYFTLNQVNHDQRPITNGMSKGQGAKNHNITSRRYLLIDSDPTKGSTKDSSSKVEKQGSLALLMEVSKWLATEHGWPQPFIADSGNGYHVLFRIDLPTADEGLIKTVLTALGHKFQSAAASIDARVYDPVRFCRLYGSLNRKGTATDERPHRRSSILKTPTTVNILSQEQLQKVANEAPPEAIKTIKNKAKYGHLLPVGLADDFDIDKTLGAGNMAAKYQIKEDEVFEKARLWMAEQPRSKQGENGQDVTFGVACGLARGFGMNGQEVLDLLKEYNSRCEPPYCEYDLEHKATDAVAAALEEPGRIGWGLAPRASQKKSTPEPAAANPSSAEGAGVPKVKAKDKEKAEKKEKVSQTSELIQFSQLNAKMWKADFGQAYASVRANVLDGNSHTENLLIQSQAYEDWMVKSWCAITNDLPPKKSAREEAIDSLGCLARMQKEQSTSVRVGHTDGAIWVDLCDEKWQAVKITSNGWEVVPKADVKFIRHPAMAEQTKPVSGGSWDLLRPFVAVSDEQWPMYQAFLLGCYMPSGTYPFCFVSGQQGGGKSTMAKVTQLLIDPSGATPPVGIPKKQEDLMISARSAHLIQFNNVSKINENDSDFLCCLVEGTTSRRRTLYKDSAESFFSAKKPVMANGIGQVAVRGDLLDRAVLLEIVPVEVRRDEDELWKDFESKRGLILGAIFDTVSTALRDCASVVIADPKPRLVDFVRFATAAEQQLGHEQGTMLEAYRENRMEGQKQVIGASPVASLLRPFLVLLGGEFQGTSAELLTKLHQFADSLGKSRRNLPQSAQSLGQTLDRIAPDLVADGIGMSRSRNNQGRMNHLWLIEQEQTQSATEPLAD